MEEICMEKRVRDKYSQLTKRLISANMTITTMESATSGQIASLITDTEGASAIMKGAFITYSNEAKIMQGVSENVIREYSVYSEETALAMAAACQKTYASDIGIGVTGTMGNVDPANQEASVPGQVYFAIRVKNEARSWKKQLPPQESRLAYKLAVAELVCDALMPLIGFIDK